MKKKLDSNKPTILYLPAWSHYSSIDKYLNTIRSLSNDYNIVVKLHHATFNQEANRLCKLLSSPELIVLGDYFDPLPLYKLADIVLVDNGGAIYDAILLEKPVIMLNISSQSNEYDILYERNRFHPDAEAVIIPTMNRPEELKSLITNNICKKAQLDDSLKYSLFFKTDGNAGKRITR